MMQLVTHFDLDGAVSEIIIKKYMTVTKSFACGYSKFDKAIDNADPDLPILFTDVSLTIEQADKLNYKLNGNWKVWDHHPDTALLKEKYTDNVIYEPDMCGAMICFNEVSDKQEEDVKLVTLTDVYDRWQTDHPLWADAYKLNLLYWSIGHWNFVKRFANGKLAYTSREKNVINRELTYKNRMLKQADVTELDNNAVVVITNRSVVNDFTLVMEKDLYIIIGEDSRSGGYSLSVRSKCDDIKLSTILNELVEECPEVDKGGGHDKAGGLSLYDGTIENYIDIAQKLYNKIFI